MDRILLEQGFQQSGVCNNSECAVHVGQLVGVDQIIGGTIGKLASIWVITLRRIDVEKGTILKMSEEKFKGELEDLLLVGLPSAVAKLMSDKTDSLTSAIPAPVVPTLNTMGSTENTLTPEERDMTTEQLAEHQKIEKAFRHKADGFHWIRQGSIGVASAVEAGAGVRFGARLEGFGASLGFGGYGGYFLLQPARTQDASSTYENSYLITPDFRVGYQWGRHEIAMNLGYSRHLASGLNYESYMAGMLYSHDLGMPYGWGYSAGLNYLYFKCSDSYSSWRPSGKSCFFPVAALTYEF